jgi:lysozyme
MGIEIPRSRPQMKRVEAEAALSPFILDQFPVKLLGIRGYYKDSIGKPGMNDIDVYDDALIVVAPSHYSTWNFNTDPTRYEKTIARLKEGGPYLYKIGLHNMKHPYEALRQWGRVTVIRGTAADEREETDTADHPFFIDIHKGGVNTTSSLGCQTLPLSQWDEFLKTVKYQIKLNKQSIIPYCLIAAK